MLHCVNCKYIGTRLDSVSSARQVAIELTCFVYMLCCAVQAAAVRWRWLYTDGKFESQNGSTALMYAAVYGHTDCVRLLIDAGADKDAKDWVRVGRCFGVGTLPFFTYPAFFSLS